MQPSFRIIADRQDITDTIRDRLLSLVVTDQSGGKTDMVEIRLDDRDGIIELPRKGAELDIAMGYAETGLAKMGLFTVDELELSGPPDTLIIKGKAANMRDSLKERKTRAWDEVTLDNLVATVAAEHKLEPRVGEFLGAIHIPHLDQTEESDLHLLTRLARQYDALTKPAGGALLFVPKGEAKSASGKTVPPVTIHRSETSDHRISMPDRGKYKAVIAHWHDTSSGNRTPVRIGDGKPVHTLKHTYSDQATARHAAQANMDALERGVATASITLKHGNPKLAAGGGLTLEGFRQGADGNWLTTQVVHTLSGGGYSTRVEAETPKKR
ncbi:MAG: contractile injection system protein, VgrG/Pvc8 family [Candidatus Sedimenticola sp. 6PFRAG7]